jgi:hypothetical protein
MNFPTTSTLTRWTEPALYVVTIILLIAGASTMRTDIYNSKNLLLTAGVLGLLGWAYHLKDESVVRSMIGY